MCQDHPYTHMQNLLFLTHTCSDIRAANGPCLHAAVTSFLMSVVLQDLLFLHLLFLTHTYYRKIEAANRPCLHAAVTSLLMPVVLQDRPRGPWEGLQALHRGHLLVAAGSHRSGDPAGAADVGGAAAEGPRRARPPAL